MRNNKRVVPGTPEHVGQKGERENPKTLTSGDDALQPDDVGMVELPHDGRLGQEVPPLLVRVARLQTLDGHVDLPLTLHTQPTAANLAKLS